MQLCASRLVTLATLAALLTAVPGCSSTSGNDGVSAADAFFPPPQVATIAKGASWRVERVALHGGKQDGVELIRINNGALVITVIPTRGMGILDVRDARTNERLLGWDSPVKEVVHPKYVDLESRGGLGWLEGFNEWMVRCGLANAGHPGKDVFTNNTGDKAEMDLTLHGKAGNIPASEVRVIIDPAPSNRIRVQGVVNERMFYGPKLKLVAEVSTEPGAGALRISDTITNEGAFDEEFQIIYHANFGVPLLEKGAQVVVAAEQVTPMNANAAKAVEQWTTYAGPTKGFVEEVYLINPYSDSQGHTAAVLHNAKGDRGVSMRWPTEQLPYLTIWKNTSAQADGYVTGIEPGTGFPFNRRVERKFGRVPKLAPQQTRRFDIDVQLLADQSAVEAATKAVRQISGARATRTNTAPPSTE